MDKSLKQIADELKIDKQKIYRFVVNNDVLEAHQKSNVKYYDEKAQALIKKHFTGEGAKQTASREVLESTLYDVLLKQFDVLQKELNIKNQQIAAQAATIENLSAALQSAQALHAGTIQQQLTLPENTKRSWQFWKRSNYKADEKGMR